jgi:hypothetical protein
MLWTKNIWPAKAKPQKSFRRVCKWVNCCSELFSSGFVESMNFNFFLFFLLLEYIFFYFIAWSTRKQTTNDYDSYKNFKKNYNELSKDKGYWWNNMNPQVLMAWTTILFTKYLFNK